MREEIVGEHFEMDDKPFTFVMLKPLGMDIAGHLLSRFHEIGQIRCAERGVITPYDIEAHYGEKVNKRYFPAIVEYLSGKETCKIILQARSYGSPSDYVDFVRREVGVLKPHEAKMGTVRHLAMDYRLPFMQIMPQEDPNLQQFCYDNLVHTSDTFDNVMREVNIWFRDRQEIVFKVLASYFLQKDHDRDGSEI